MIIVPASRRATRPACATRPLTEVVGVPSRAAAALAAAPRWRSRPVCADRRLDAAPAPAVVADIKWADLPLAA